MKTAAFWYHVCWRQPNKVIAMSQVLRRPRLVKAIGLSMVTAGDMEEARACRSSAKEVDIRFRS